MNYSRGFFEGKRPWSKIKDQILIDYLPPYLNKVKNLQRRIILVDGFAGPGYFEDGSFGSPYFICKIADKYLKSRFIAIFVNKEKQHHDKLTSSIKDYIESNCAFTIHGTANDLLEKLKIILSDETIFIYLDQFGIAGFDFNSLLPYISRTQKHSTELLINISVPIIHRLSAKSTIPKDQVDYPGHNTLTNVFGGDYWKDFLYDDTLSGKEQVINLMIEYKTKLQEYLHYVGFCPVYETGPNSTLKYFIFFSSRHIDAALLLNDIMFTAYWKHIWDCTIKGTLFEDQSLDDSLPCNYVSDLRSLIISNLRQSKMQRIELWKKIITDDFMRFHSKSYRNTIRELIKSKRIGFIKTTDSGKLNDLSILKILG